MNFIFQNRPELLSSINFTLAPSLGAYSAVVVIGAILLAAVVVWALLYSIKNHRVLNPGILLGLFSVAWLPLFLHFVFVNAGHVRDGLFLLGRPYSEQVRWRFCQIDAVQNLAGSLCGLPLFIEKVKEYVPPQASIALAKGPLNMYVEYYLADAYILDTPADRADYFIVYHSGEPLAYAQDGTLYRNPGVDFSISSSQESLGKFSIDAQLDSQRLIFKRQK